MKLKKSLLLVVLLLISSLIVFGCTKSVTNTPAVQENPSDQLSIVASTSWTALIAEAATGESVDVIAPVELRHPPEYDFKPSDIVAVQEADWVILAGYEGFMKKILESNSIDEEKTIQIRTTNTYDHLVAQTRVIAEKLGTLEIQQSWENEFTNVMNSILEQAENKEISQTKVLVHMHMADFVRSLGFEVLEVYGAEELSPAKIGELSKLNPDLIIDNYHNPQGIAIAEVSGVARVELRNFPGPQHKSIIELVTDNATILGLY
ncbi:metal ABC transporter solute-binding protein, Zn/Mn family [Serpentinicella alkaliphila]|uniref:Zinc transport system substrate-binding protein/iron/zinc/copper transport system substrate-binding protein n=1 Tax=Serpentinicella alkaliphila TaxID=1734049 RepID=A0A4R2T138_9FIRM|nr:zinc ABC transporter substrate-binding protein [Serpentinicella alkaliphila]QUH27032.1 zinc ABC transporter solute-binding protein [Serpentinicella alkaliphila]TCP95625.1 zinc transport system substrate-binding protein/iron/zinc/copper transport system substrate-binding protein [Serpentinicella alkaliphila]